MGDLQETTLVTVVEERTMAWRPSGGCSGVLGSRAASFCVLIWISHDLSFAFFYFKTMDKQVHIRAIGVVRPGCLVDGPAVPLVVVGPQADHVLAVRL